MSVVLNVAEKPSVAKAVASILSNNQMNRLHDSKGTLAFDFQYQHPQFGACRMIMTAVAGHLRELEFEPRVSKWSSVDPVELFTAQVVSNVPDDKRKLQQNLQQYSRRSTHLILWLDCDREGEKIAFDVLEECRAVKPNLQVLRARFSALTKQEVTRAMANLVQPDRQQNDAVGARQEIDLRIGSAFTRFQTMFLQNRVPQLAAYTQGQKSSTVSYGPCLMPTLGFVVDRSMKRQLHVSERFWSIALSASFGGDTCADFKWSRGHLFDKGVVTAIHSILVDVEGDSLGDKEVHIDSVVDKESTWRRPVPLHTVTLQKECARYLRLSAKQTMTLAEGLYQKGFLSYPRTETTVYKRSEPLQSRVAALCGLEGDLGQYAVGLSQQGRFQWPRSGGSDDGAHPPIHPLKSATRQQIGVAVQGRAWEVFELVTRHFLASCGPDARVANTRVECQLRGERFFATGRRVLDRGYLKVWRYSQVSGRTLPDVLREGAHCVPAGVRVTEGATQAPLLLKEQQLIALMDANGIGTDATIAQHIENIQKKGFCTKDAQGYLAPTMLGQAMVVAYDRMGLSALWKPNLRANMEQKMKAICDGAESRRNFVEQCLRTMRQQYDKLVRNAAEMTQTLTALGGNLPQQTRTLRRSFVRCGRCDNETKLVKNGADERFAQCDTCDLTLKLPWGSLEPVAETTCPICRFQVVQVRNQKNKKTHFVCPFCFVNPPREFTDIEESARLLQNHRCFQCTHPRCKLAKGTQQTVLRRCSCDAQKGGYTLRQVKGEKYVVSCRNYPACKERTMWLTSEVLSARPSPTQRCLNERCADQAIMLEMKLRDLATAQRIDGNSNNGTVTMCPFCDARFLRFRLGRS